MSELLFPDDDRDPDEPFERSGAQAWQGGVSSLAHARELLFAEDRFKAGSQCPCCDQFVKLYRRKLNSGMARMLIWMVFASEGREWVHPGREAPSSLTLSHDWYGLEHFGLARVRREREDGKMKRTSGMWVPTELGVEFAMNRSQAPAYASIYNQGVHGVSDETVTIIAALGDHFSYEELMRGGAS